MTKPCNPHGRIRCSECEHVRELEQDIKHYKAITELAVKGLKEVMKDAPNETDSYAVAKFTLFEIERLSHETP